MFLLFINLDYISHFFVVSVKVLYTDYINILIPYICVDINLNGKCNDNGKRMRIMSRSRTVTPEVKSRLMKYLDTACMTADVMKDTVHNGLSINIKCLNQRKSHYLT